MINRVTSGAAIGLLCSTVGMGTAVAQSAPDSAADHAVIQTDDGPVRGVLEGGVYRFLGIPYAAPPVGELRWRPPAPVAKHALLDATRHAAICPQVNTVGVFAGPQSVEEDCLYLNIFTSGPASSSKALKPVIVWFHGGGNYTGSANDYDGGALAQGGPDGVPTVVVTLNYRLGLLGYLALPGLMKEANPTANYGTLDQQAALQWIKANIAKFGGDPSKVAISGQSGGSVDVHANVVSPLAAGLFNRAIFQSAPHAIFSALEPAIKRGTAFSTAAGCSGANETACLRKLPVARILQLQGTSKENGPYIDPASQNVIIDGTVIPMQVADAYRTGSFNKVPVMGGMTQDEMTFVMAREQYYAPVPVNPSLAGSGQGLTAFTRDRYFDAVKARYGQKSAAVLAEYSLEKFGGDAGMAHNRVQADPSLCNSNLRSMKVLAAKVPAYAYIFTYQNAPFFFPKMAGFKPLAAHTIDIQFLFPGFHGGILGVNIDQDTGVPRELNEQEVRLSQRLIGFWTNFANTGNPNRPGSALWPSLGSTSAAIMQQDISLSTIKEPEYRAKYHCDFWDSL